MSALSVKTIWHQLCHSPGTFENGAELSVVSVGGGGKEILKKQLIDISHCISILSGWVLASCFDKKRNLGRIGPHLRYIQVPFDGRQMHLEEKR